MILTARLKVKQRLILNRKCLYLQFYVLGAVEKLKQIVVLAFHDIVIHECCHVHLVLRQLLQTSLLRELIMLSQHVVDINFLQRSLMSIFGYANDASHLQVISSTYFGSQKLDQYTDGLHVLRLVWVLHHGLHVLLHLRKLALGCKDSDQEKVLCLNILDIITLDLS